MARSIVFLIILLLNLNGSVNALNRISKFYLNNGVSACNGEGPNCNDFLTKAIELNADQFPILTEIGF